jgi:hypothetical protein
MKKGRTARPALVVRIDAPAPAPAAWAAGRRSCRA